MPRMKLIHGQNWLSAVAAADDLPLLEINMDVYYIQWMYNSEFFYMTDMSNDGKFMKWTRNQEDGYQILSEDEASAYLKTAISVGRKELNIIEVEIPLQLELLGEV